MTESDPDPRTLDLFLSPRQVAIIGLSPRRGRRADQHPNDLEGVRLPGAHHGHRSQHRTLGGIRGLRRPGRGDGIRILGPNTIGVANAFSSFTSSFIETRNETFPVGLVSQSGLFTVGHNIVNNEPAGFCMAADLGNASDIGLDEALAYYEGVDGVRVTQCHHEGVQVIARSVLSGLHHVYDLAA